MGSEMCIRDSPVATGFLGYTRSSAALGSDSQDDFPSGVNSSAVGDFLLGEPGEELMVIDRRLDVDRLEGGGPGLIHH